MTESQQQKRMRDAYPYNDSANAMELSTADRRFEQLIDRREKLIERSRFGMLALNGASAIGMVSSFDVLSEGLGIDPRYALSFFTVGMFLPIVSIYFETIFLGNRAAQMFGHLSSLRRLRSTLDSNQTEENEKSFAEQLDILGERAGRESITKIHLDDSKDGLPNDFAYSPVALATWNFSAGAWIAGASFFVAGLYGLK